MDDDQIHHDPETPPLLVKNPDRDKIDGIGIATMDMIAYRHIH